jgi:hypothetical protein
VCPARCLKGAPHALPSSPVDGTSPLAIGFLFFSLQLFSGYDNIEQFVCYNLFCSIAFVDFISTSWSLLHTNFLICYFGFVVSLQYSILLLQSFRQESIEIRFCYICYRCLLQ